MSSPPVIDYRTLRSDRLPAFQRTAWFKCILACWLIPLVIGVTTLGLFKVWPSDVFEAVGMLDVIWGFFLLGVAALLMFAFVVFRWGITERRWVEVIVPCLMSSLLLATNVPVAGVLMALAMPMRI